MSSGKEHHLDEVYRLYRKVLKFDKAVKLKHTYNPLEDKYHHYIKDDIETVLNVFSEVFSLSEEESQGLKSSMRSGEIDFLRFITDENTMQEGQFPLLYILSKPFFHSFKSALEIDNIYWQDGRCPVCRAVPSLSIIEKESKRIYFCSFCGSLGSYKRIGCPFCKNTDSGHTNILLVRDNDDVRVDTCEVCKSYVKSFTKDVVNNRAIEEMDLESLPVDIVVQNKGFHRRSPNPIGIVEIK
jgi:FdhE protein